MQRSDCLAGGDVQLSTHLWIASSVASTAWVNSSCMAGRGQERAAGRGCGKREAAAGPGAGAGGAPQPAPTPRTLGALGIATATRTPFRLGGVDRREGRRPTAKHRAEAVHCAMWKTRSSDTDVRWLVRPPPCRATRRPAVLPHGGHAAAMCLPCLPLRHKKVV